MNQLDTLRTRLRKLTVAELDALAKDADVPKSTARKVAYGHVADPRYSTVSKLIDSLRKRRKRR